MRTKAMKKRWIMCAAAVVALTMPATPADAQQAPGDTLQVHVVRRGDTLWDISRRYLRDPFRWTEIFQLNRGTVANPHLIFPAERIRIPLAARDATRAQGWNARGLVEENRTIFFEPEMESVAEHRLRLAQLAPASAVTRGDYLRAGLLVQETEVMPLGRLVELLSPSVVPIQIAPQIQLYDRVYLTLSQPGSIEVGDRLQLLREGRRIRPYGRVFNTTGVARVAELSGNVATVVIEEMFDIVSVGDAAVAMPQFEGLAGVRATAASGVNGRIVAFQTPHALQNVEDIAYVDVGSASGVGEGDEFMAFLPAEQRSWGLRPEIEVARLRIIRTSDQTAAARVIGLQQPALETGLLVRLVARMP
ncbi:hypothetical protein BH23GEM6_BH23GEM6_14080 [soil metagenome]